MRRNELIQALQQLKVQTGSLACLGCGHEHNCSIHGCAIIRAAIEALEEKSPPIGRCGECKHQFTGDNDICFSGIADEFCSGFEPKQS